MERDISPFWQRLDELTKDLAKEFDIRYEEASEMLATGLKVNSLKKSGVLKKSIECPNCGEEEAEQLVDHRSPDEKELGIDHWYCKTCKADF